MMVKLHRLVGDHSTMTLALASCFAVMLGITMRFLAVRMGAHYGFVHYSDSHDVGWCVAWLTVSIMAVATSTWTGLILARAGISPPKLLVSLLWVPTCTLLGLVPYYAGTLMHATVFRAVLFSREFSSVWTASTVIVCGGYAIGWLVASRIAKHWINTGKWEHTEPGGWPRSRSVSKLICVGRGSPIRS